MQTILPKSRGPRRTADERRDEVLDAAIVEFATFGLYGASTEAIAARAGISQPYVLRLFGTKKSLFLAALERVTGQILDRWAEGLGLHDEEGGIIQATPAQKLRVLGKQYVHLVEEVHSLRLVLQSFSSAEDPDVRTVVHASMKRLYAFVAHHTGASPDEIQRFWAQGMMLTVAASIRAIDESDSEMWAQTFVHIPID
ncbi:MAG: TetR/AcrR family transcriptional regulator [Thermomicrobiales bacterium]